MLLPAPGTFEQVGGYEGRGGLWGAWPPHLWRPADHAWFLGADTDLDTTYVAGTRALVDDLPAAHDLEASEVSPETGLAHRGDDVNV